MVTTKQRKKASQAEAQHITDQIRYLSDEALQCRTLRHAWQRGGGFYKVEVEGGTRGALYVERQIHCMRGCNVVRVELFRVHATYMEKLVSKYSYPKEGYKISGPRVGLDVAGMLLLEEYMREMAEVNGLRGAGDALGRPSD